MNDILIATPTYNEAGNIAALLRQLAALGLAADYLVVDDGSTDGTPDIVLRLAAEIPQLRLMQRGSKQGVGSAHIDALKYAKSNGYLTLLSDGERLTGAHGLGPEAGEWIQQATVAIRAGVPLDVLRDTIQPFPTFSEIYVVALKALRKEIGS